MNKNFLLFTLILTSQFTHAVNYIDENVKKYNWNGIEVVWLEDDSLPTYDISIYFNQGALGDTKTLAGRTEIMFNQLTSGTKKYTQKEIIESLEFYGARYGSNVTHEYADFSVSGLVKDYIPTMKMVCHLFQEATFPEKELAILKQRVLSSLESVVTNHSALANHVFRFESLNSTGFETPVGGNIHSIKKIESKHLKSRLDEINSKVNKRIYIKGPKKILGVKKIITEDCGWKTKNIAKMEYPFVEKPVMNEEIIFVDVPKANQVQIRIGRVLTSGEVNEDKKELKAFAAKFMGGGFTSRLIQELRVKRGLTYSASAYSSEQKMYGRAGINTFTRNDKILDTLETIKEVIRSSSQEIAKDTFQISKNNIKGNYLLSLESTSDFLKNLMFFDHINRDYDEIYEFIETINNVKEADLAKIIKELYGWKNQTIVLLGDKSLIKDLVKAGYKVRRVDYKSYL